MQRPFRCRRRQDWAAFDSHAAEYTRVHASGLFLHDRETLVDALTELGPGAWVLTPLQTDDGVILVNRGFVPPERREAGTRVAGNEAGQVVVNGLLRASEPHGRFLRPNKPAEGRWFSRDVVAIARAQRIAGVAPFFIDAEAAAPATDAAPRGGLTVVRFRNAHLVYALTWFGLAILCITGLVMLRRISRT